MGADAAATAAEGHPGMPGPRHGSPHESPHGAGTSSPLLSVPPSGTTIKATFNQGEFLLVDGTHLRDADDIPTMLAAMGTSLKTGITDSEAEARIREFGRNELPEYHTSAWRKFLGYMWNPLSWVMEVAAVMAIVFSNGNGLPPDWEDFVGIVVLLFLNASLAYYEESKAGDAVAALKNQLAPTATVLRDGTWIIIPGDGIVPGDLVQIKLGAIVPADAVIVEGENINIDQAALTGESLPVKKVVGDELFSGSTVKQGELIGLVSATGLHTFFGKAANLVATTENVGHFKEVLANIGKFCIGLIAIFMVAELVVMYPVLHYGYRRGINNLLVLLIGGIPIAMPTVLSVTLAIGAHQLAAKQAIVSKMSAIEELAGMDMLCSDKTGTLTLNRLTIDRESFVCLAAEYGIDDCIKYAAYASRTENADAIDAVVIKSLNNPEDARAGIELLHFTPFDPTTKRTEATIRTLTTGKVMKCSKGMCATLLNVVGANDATRKRVEGAVNGLAAHGLRALGVAICNVEEDCKDVWQFIAVMPIYDPPREDTADTIAKAIQLGVSVKMLTGDQLEIAQETARRLQMGPNIYRASILREYKESDTGMSKAEFIEKSDGFAGVFPEHKYEIVRSLKDGGHIVGMTGDGVNDAPALKAADVGVAVADATDAARAAASIVLLTPGLSVIIDAILTSRKIFQRMKAYALYACATTVRVVLSFSILVWAYEFDFPPFMVLIMAILNDGTIMTISRDRVVPSPQPDAWNLKRLFTRAIVMGAVQALATIIFFHLLFSTDFFEKMGLASPWRVDDGDTFVASSGVTEISFQNPNHPQLHSIIYLQSSVLGQASVFVARASGALSFQVRPGFLLVASYVAAQLTATLITVYADWGFTDIQGTRTWGWPAAAWVWSLVWFVAVDILDRITEHLLLQSWHSHLWFQGYSGLNHSLDHMNSSSSQRRGLASRGPSRAIRGGTFTDGQAERALQTMVRHRVKPATARAMVSSV